MTKEAWGSYDVPGQMSIFDYLCEEQQEQAVLPGDTTKDPERIGRRLPWSEAVGTMMGRIIWIRHDLQSMTYWEAVRPVEALVKRMKGYRLDPETGKYTEYMYDRLICEDGHRYQKALIDEIYCSEKLYATK